MPLSLRTRLKVKNARGIFKVCCTVHEGNERMVSTFAHLSSAHSAGTGASVKCIMTPLTAPFRSHTVNTLLKEYADRAKEIKTPP
eukprot:5145085-Pyramimonas_sp.AAC.1